MAEVPFVKLHSDKCHWTLLMISQHWFRYWLDAVRQQAITRANVDSDLCRHMVLTGPQWVKQGMSNIFICFTLWYIHASVNGVMLHWVITNWIFSTMPSPKRFSFYYSLLLRAPRIPLVTKPINLMLLIIIFYMTIILVKGAIGWSIQ